MRSIYNIAFILCILLFPSQIWANATKVSGKIYQAATSQDVFTLLQQTSTPFIILDIRTPKEFVQGHILGAQLLDFFAPDFREKLAKLDKKASYIVYCRTGHRSTQALALMQELDFQNVIHMHDGIVGWKKNHLPLSK